MRISKVFSHSIVYGFTGVASTLSAVFLVPVYTRILSPSDYGITAIIAIVVSVMTIIFNLGLSSAIFWAYFRASDEEEKRKVIGTAFLFQIIFGIFMLLLLILLSAQINTLLFPNGQPTIYLKIAAFTIFFQSSFTLPLAIFRALEKPFIYVAISISNLLLNIFLSVFLVVFLRLGVMGVFLANLGSVSIIYLISVPFILKKAKLQISIKWLKDMLSFGLPMIPAGLSIWVLNSSDRYFLNHFVGLDSVGIYNVGYRIGMLLILLTGAVQLAYVPFMFSIAKRPDARNIYSRFATYYFTLLVFAALTLSIFSKEAVQILTGANFHSAYVIVPFIAFSYVAYGMYFNFATGVSIKKKTIFSMVATIVAGIVNILLNYFLIMKFAMLGAAISTLISFVLLMLLIYYFSNRVYHIDYQFKRMFKVLSLGVVMVFIGVILNLPLFINLIIKFGLIISFLIILYFIKFFTEEEMKKIKLIFKKLAQIWYNPKLIVKLIFKDIAS